MTGSGMSTKQEVVDVAVLRLQPFVFRVLIWAQQTEKVRKRFKTV
jgi:hypothetical protein